MDTPETEDFKPKYPHVYLDITYLDRDPMTLIKATMDAMKARRVPQQAIQEFASEALTSKYNSVLDTIHDWVDVQDVQYETRYEIAGDLGYEDRVRADMKSVRKNISHAVDCAVGAPTYIGNITYLRQTLEKALETIRFDESLVREARVALKVRKEMLEQNTNRADGTVSP